MQEKKNASDLRHKILTIIGIVICVILAPMLIINCTLLIKGAVNKDEVPSFGNLFPLIVLTGSMEDEFPAGSLIFCSVAEPSPQGSMQVSLHWTGRTVCNLTIPMK